MLSAGVPVAAPLLLAATLAGMAAPAAAAPSQATCEWRSPAADPFTGDVPAAVDDYADIPAATRARLKERMKRFAYDDIITIRRDSIEGNFRYEPALLDMHFGKQRMCREMTRKTWRADHEERALAYCEDGHCVVVPLVCRNVSRVIRQPAPVALGSGPVGGAHPLVFEAPGAGLQPIPDTPSDAPGPNARPLDVQPPAALPPLPGSEAPAPAMPLPPLPPAVQTPAPSPLTPLPSEAPPPAVVTPPPAPEVPGLIPQPAEPTPVLPPIGVPPLPPATPAIPEPTTWLLWTAGLAAVAAWRRRKLS